MAIDTSERLIQIPQGVQVQISAGKVTVTGPKGAINRDLSHMPVQLESADGKVTVRAKGTRKQDKAMVGTAAAHINNMIEGASKGFAYRLKVVYAHFPVTVKVLEKEKKVSIENFSGEKTPRFASIVGDVSVKVQGDEITVEGKCLDDVSQTASNIQEATTIPEKDQRVFLDGIYVFEKGLASKK
jgi:large subunit ribosomal protein L6